MATKYRYTATFSDGTTAERRSDHAYTHAWQVKALDAPAGSIPIYGFSASRELALKAAATNTGWVRIARTHSRWSHDVHGPTVAEIAPAVVTR